MIYQLAEKMTSWFIAQGVLKQSDYDVYVYCIDSLLAKVFYYVTLLTVASWLHILPATVCFYVGFTPFRYTAGGYHAKTDNRCILLTWMMYGLSMLCIAQAVVLPKFYLAVICLLLVLFSSSVALRHAPLDHFHKPVPMVKKLRMRKQCLVFQILFVAATIFLLAQDEYCYAFSLALGNGVAGMLLLIAHYQKRRNLV